MTRLIAILLGLFGVSGAFADPLDGLLAKGGGAACFVRTYDEDHMSAHPMQTTKAVVLSLKAGRSGTVIRIRFDTRKGMRVVYGGCGWSESANLDVQDKPLIKAFKGPSGLDCHAMTDEDGTSAEEGGDFPVDLRDGQSIMLYMPEELAAWPSYDRSHGANFIDFGADDQVFKLDRTGSGDCRDLIVKLPQKE